MRNKKDFIKIRQGKGGKMNLKIKLFVVFISILSIDVGNGALWNDFRITFSTTPWKLNGFKQLPKTVEEAKKSKWDFDSDSCSPTAPFNGIRYTYPKEGSVAVIYDINEIVAGIQIFLKHDEVLSSKNDIRYDLVDMYQNETRNGNQVFVLTAYFINPSKLCEKGRTKESLTTEGIGTGLYFQTGKNPSNYKEVPLKRDEAIEKGWTKKACIPLMGRHNFYEVEKWEEKSCQEVFPAFTLYNTHDQLHGFGFVTGGLAKSERFEHPPELAIRAITGFVTPDCIIKQNKRIGTTSMHVYFINPWLIGCL